MKSFFFNLSFVFYPSFYYQFLQKYFESVKSCFSPLDLTSCFSRTSSPLICFSPSSLIVFMCFSNALPRGEYVCKLSLFHRSFFLSEDSIFSTIRYAYLDIHLCIVYSAYAVTKQRTIFEYELFICIIWCSSCCCCTCYSSFNKYICIAMTLTLIWGGGGVEG